MSVALASTAKLGAEDMTKARAIRLNQTNGLLKLPCAMDWAVHGFDVRHRFVNELLTQLTEKERNSLIGGLS